MTLRSRLADHRLFLVALAVGALLRVLTTIAWWPGFVFSDGPTYLAIADDLVPSPDRTIGYSVVLRALGLSGDVWRIAVVQHVVGLLTAVLLYALLRRRGVGAGVATLATLPVLLDGMQLVLEHAVLSDVLNMSMVVGAVALLAWWRRPPTWAVALAGLVLGLAVVVKVAGEPMLLAAVVFVVAASAGWRRRLVHVVVVVATFAAPLVAYAAWYHADNGAWALTQSGGRSLYMRTTTFVDCTRLTLPSYERPLCPEEPLGQRRDPTYYGWHDPDGQHGLTPPAGITPDDAMRDFAKRAIEAQPGDYARTVARDFVSTFYWERVDLFEYDTAYKWRFSGWYGYRPTVWTRPAYLAHGDTLPRNTGPLAQALSGYGSVVYLWGPLAALLAVLALVGALSPRPRDARGLRAPTFLLVSLGLGLVLVPDVTGQFTWRYTLPVVVLLPAAAALAWTRLRGGSPAQPSRLDEDGVGATDEPSSPVEEVDEGDVESDVEPAASARSRRPNSLPSRT